MHTHERRLVSLYLTFSEGQMHAAADRVSISVTVKFAELSLNFFGTNKRHSLLICDPIVNEIDDGADFEPVLFGK